jgi:hypothetical protein
MSIRSVVLFSAVCLSLSFHGIHPGYADTKADNKNIAPIKTAPYKKTAAYNQKTDMRYSVIDLLEKTFARPESSEWATYSIANMDCTEIKSKTKCKDKKTGRIDDADVLNSTYTTSPYHFVNTHGLLVLDTYFSSQLPISFTVAYGADETIHPVLTSPLLPSPPLTVKSFDKKTNTAVFEISAKTSEYTYTYIQRIQFHFIDADHVDISIDFKDKDAAHSNYFEKLSLSRITHVKAQYND